MRNLFKPCEGYEAALPQKYFGNAWLADMKNTLATFARFHMRLRFLKRFFKSSGLGSHSQHPDLRPLRSLR